MLGLLLLSACRSAPPEHNEIVFLADHLFEADKTAEAAALSDFDASRWTLEGETRYAIVAPLASRITYTVVVPEEPVLRFATALYPIGDDAGSAWTTLRRAEFRVRVDGGGYRETIFSETVRRHEAGTWIDRSLDLRSFAGSTVRLSLEVQPPDRFRRDPADLQAAREQYLVLWGNPVLDSESAQEAGTNVILVSLDCLRADHVGIYGYREGATPHLDAFARDGVLFETAIATAPSTLPSHMSMFTGLTPLLHGANNRRARFDRTPYLPDLLSRAGFEVNGVVTGPYLSQNFGLHEGFHSYKFMFDPRGGDAVDAALDVLEQGKRTPAVSLSPSLRRSRSVPAPGSVPT